MENILLKNEKTSRSEGEFLPVPRVKKVNGQKKEKEQNWEDVERNVQMLAYLKKESGQ